MASFRYIAFKRQRRREKEERNRAISRAEKDFTECKTRNPYRGVNQNIAWDIRMKELVNA